MKYFFSKEKKEEKKTTPRFEPMTFGLIGFITTGSAIDTTSQGGNY